MPDVWRTTRGALWLGLLGLVLLGLSVPALVLRPEASEVPLWWPVAGVAAAAVLRSGAVHRTPVLTVVALATASAHVLAGRPVLLAAALGVANAAEAAVVATVARAGGVPFGLADLQQLTRLVLASGAGALLAGAVNAGLLLAWQGGGDATMLLYAVVLSHGSALLLLLPLAAPLPRATGEAGRFERLLQAGALAVLLTTVFREEQVLPVTILPVLALVWASVRCGVLTVLAELAVTAAVVTAATLSGWGPFADTDAGVVDDLRGAVSLVQTYLVLSLVIALVPTLALHERSLAVQQLALLARQDPLTALPNRRLLLEELERLQARSDRTGEPATILALDLDGFKAVNDVHGHQVGDEVLVEVADRLQAQARTGDVLARVGGDEFVVLCPGLEPGTAALTTVVERLRQAIARPLRTLPGVRLGVSIGAARVAPRAPAGENLHVADVALYVDKSARRRSGPSGGGPHT